MVKLSEIPLYSKDAPPKEILMAKTARPLTWLILHTNISANGVTFLSMVMALIGCAFMVPGIYWLSLVGLAFFCLFMLLDHCDGQVARCRHYSSKAGLYFDSRVHHIVEPMFFICCGIGCYIAEFNKAVGFLYLGAGIAAAVFYLMRQLCKVPDLETGFRTLEKERSFFGKINYFMFQFLRINYPFSLLFFAIIFNQTGPILMIYALIFMANLIISFYKTYKELRDSNEPLLLSN
jgi:phosphatidylglycerophosphate synthase